MERGLYIAASGMLAEMARQDQLANDLANASTAGYKADRTSQKAFGDLLLSNTQTGQTIGKLGSGAAIDKQVTDFTQAAVRQTDQPLDMAIQGEGFFGVKTPQGVRYTRDGSFVANAKGNLADKMGNEVLGAGNKPVAVDPDGKVDAANVGVFALKTATKQGDSYFTGTAGGKATGTVKTGALEGSGVDPARAMVDLMGSLRALEATQRAITTIDSTLQQTASQVGNLPG